MADLRKIDVGRLRPFRKNPRKGDVAAIADSLRVNGQYRPVVVNKGTHTGRKLEVLCGNHTLEAAKSLGWKTIDTVVVDVDEESAARIVAADNRTADLGGYDTAALVDLLEELDDLAGTGYTEAELEDLRDDLLLPDTITMPTSFGEDGEGAQFKTMAFAFGPASIQVPYAEGERLLSQYDAWIEAHDESAGWVTSLVERVAGKLPEKEGRAA